MTIALMKQLLFDATLHRLPFELNADIISVVEQTLVSGVFSDQDIAWFDLYLSGYNACDIAERYITTEDKVIVVLERIIQAIAETSGYTDESFIHRLHKNRMLSKLQREKLRTVLEAYSNDYILYERES
jgi:hypothetical protein